MKKHNQLKINDIERVAIKSDGTRLPVLDGKFDFLLQPNAQDIKNGIKGDHANCMYCLACRRQFNSELVWVTRGLAYVELLGKGGKPCLYRFLLDDLAKQKVKEFDADNPSLTPEAVLFLAPKGTRTLDAARAAWHKWYAQNKELKAERKAAYLKGTFSEPSQKASRKIAQPIDSLRDNATGMFQFRVPKP